MIIMKRSFCALVLVSAVLKLASGYYEEPSYTRDKRSPPREGKDLGIFHPYQDLIPRHCWSRPKNVDMYKCCPIPQLYSDEVLDICGIEKIKEDEESPTKRSPTKLACKDGMCLMKESNLLDKDDRVDYEKLRAYLDQWAEEHPNFTEAILEAKKQCAYPDGQEKDKSECEPDQIFVCLTAFIIWVTVFFYTAVSPDDPDHPWPSKPEELQACCLLE
ncbi:hypothetical protein HW555_010717, partial [Spodoptera exigua]